MGVPLIRVRHAVHPGPVQLGRVLTAVGVSPRLALARLRAGAVLGEAIQHAFKCLHLHSGGFRLCGARLHKAAYHLALPSDTSERIIEYGDAITMPEGALIISANGTYGRSGAGGPLLHLHGALAAGGGLVRGGHLAVLECVIGPDDITLFVYGGISFQQALDSQTGFQTFVPYSI